MRSRILAGLVAVLCVGAAAGLDVRAHGGFDVKTDAACKAAIEAGFYEADMAGQCGDDYNDAGRP